MINIEPLIIIGLLSVFIGRGKDYLTLSLPILLIFINLIGLYYFLTKIRIEINITKI